MPNTTLARLEALWTRLAPRSATGRAVLGAVTAMAVGVTFGGAARALKSAPAQPSLSITAVSDTAASKTAAPKTAAPKTAAPKTAAPTKAVAKPAAPNVLASSLERSAVGKLTRDLSVRATDLAAEWRGTDVRYELKLQMRAAQQSPAVGARLAGIALGGVVVLLAAVLGVAFGLRALVRRVVRGAARHTEPAPVVAVVPAVAVAAPRKRLSLPRPAVALRTRFASMSRRRTTPAAPVLALAAAGTNRAEIARRTGLSRDAIALALACSRTA